MACSSAGAVDGPSYGISSTGFKLESETREATFVRGALIVGAGPAGLATAACLTQRGIPYIIIERADCVGSLWKNKTYDRLHLHIPKDHSELPYMKFPADYPAYPSRHQFHQYLEHYAEKFAIRPQFNNSVVDASYLENIEMWQVETTSCEVANTGLPPKWGRSIYLTRWLVVATGENADPVSPSLPGINKFGGRAFHSIEYRNGREWSGKKVLVVGCGNSGFEVSLDLANHGARTSLVVRSPMHVLPRETFGISTFVVATTLLRYMSYRYTDMLLLLYARFVMGDTAKWGIPRPSLGPLERKDVEGITPVLDVGTLKMIQTGHIKVTKGVKEITPTGAIFDDGSVHEFDCIIFATGFRSNVPNWLQDDSTFGRDGIPKLPFPQSWRGDRGLFTAGFTKRGLKGAGMDARCIAEHLSKLETSF